MLNEEKQEIIASMMPNAVLKAITPDAQKAIEHYREMNAFIKIYTFPFKMGRETRTQLVNGHLEIMERRKTLSHKSNCDSNNDVYLVDSYDLLQISREHLGIEFRGGAYTLIDRGSACGLMINGQHIAGKDEGATVPLKDGDVIGLGKDTTPYYFKFIVLKES